ncbi:hypothetical protein DPMN_164572 [Dreissena polymorpha]|uniref:Uncharacterized protein n=1 Tax=Dreissena polymorpha TaxID=45954 RepID=A0A9D4EYS4_DREPO|nr:hypothetical protein DPMN_164572 [Dreissena polymorpha]
MSNLKLDMGLLPDGDISVVVLNILHYLLKEKLYRTGMEQTFLTGTYCRNEEVTLLFFRSTALLAFPERSGMICISP